MLLIAGSFMISHGGPPAIGAAISSTRAFGWPAGVAGHLRSLPLKMTRSTLWPHQLKSIPCLTNEETT